MTGGWDPLAEPPTDGSSTDRIRWLFEHMSAFQRQRSDLPQDDWTHLKKREQNQVRVEYDLAVARAKSGGELSPALEKAIRRGSLSTTTRHPKDYVPKKS